MHQSFPSANIPQTNPWGIFLRWPKALPGAKFSCKSTGPGANNTYPREYFRRSSQPFLLTGVEISGFCRNQTLERIGRLSKYSLVIPSSFSSSIILKSFKVFPSFETDFVTREQQYMVDQFVAEKCLHAASTDNLVL